MVNAPFRFEQAARQVVLRLSSYGCFPPSHEEALAHIATIWNGAAERQPGSCMGYAQALQLAMRFR